MNSRNNKNSVILITEIMAVMVTAIFLVMKITALSVTAYIFALVGIAMFCKGSLYMLNSQKSYPWFTAFPIRIWQYLISGIVLSAIFITAENMFGWALPIRWFILLHIVLLAVCLITLILMRSGEAVIDNRGEEVTQKVAALRFVQTDMESLIQKFPEYGNDLCQVRDALRYSDPISHSSLAVYEEQIQRGIIALDNPEESTSIPERCAELLRQIADRNTKTKMVK